MSRDSVIDSMGRIDDAMIESVEKLRQKPRKKRIRMRWIAVAACLAVLVVSAEASSGLVSNLLAPLYGGVQTELVDNIGVPIGASATVAGYTLTAEAIIGDRYNFAIVYTLCREDGQPMPEGISFAEHDISIMRGPGGGSGEYRRSEDGLKYYIIEQWTSGYSVLFRGNAKVVFTDLICYNDGTEEILAEGTWELNFAVRYKDTTVKLPIDEFEVVGSNGYQYQIHKIQISPIGLYIELTSPVGESGTDFFERPMRDFNVSLILSDDSRIDLLNAAYGESAVLGADTCEVNYGVMFEQPIPLDTIKTLIICDTTVDIDVE